VFFDFEEAERWVVSVPPVTEPGAAR
jgi:hypothetical protein